MRKHKNIIMALQAFCILLLIMSNYLETSITQVAYCFTVFTSPFLLFAFGEVAFLNEKNYLAATGAVVFEACISILFVGTMVTGMKMDAGDFLLFSRLLLVYSIATILSIFERLATRVRVQ